MFSESYGYLRVAACLAALSLLLSGCVAAATHPPTLQPPATQPPATAAAQPTAAAQASATPGTAGAGLEGTWEGTLDVASQVIPIIVRFSNAQPRALLDIPSQGLKDYQFTKFSYDAPNLHLEAFPGARQAVFDGALGTDGTLSGKYTQAGYVGTFSLKRSTQAAAPTEAVPYKQEEVTVKNGDVTLAGTLTLPPSGGSLPVVVLISGSGQQNRDEDILGFQPFRLIADHLTRNGIAVLRLDDRGMGGSTGDIEKATSEDFAGDILAAVNFLKARPDINPKQIGLFGHSEGGLIGPMVAQHSSDVAFVILLAGPGLPGEQVIIQQVGAITRAGGASLADASKSMDEEKKVLDAVISGQGLDQVKADLLAKAQAQIAALPEDQRKQLGDPKAAAEQAVDTQLAALTSPWAKFFLTYDPGPALANLKVPVLALFGGKDVQVVAGPNEQAVKDALAKGGNTRGTTKVYPNANHLFQPATTGGTEEYSQLKTFVPGLLDDVTAWIKGVTGR